MSSKYDPLVFFGLIYLEICLFMISTCLDDKYEMRKFLDVTLGKSRYWGYETVKWASKQELSPYELW